MPEPRALSALQWVLIVLIVAAVVGLLAYRRNDPGVGGRIPDPEDAAAVVALDPSAIA